MRARPSSRCTAAFSCTYVPHLNLLRVSLSWQIIFELTIDLTPNFVYNMITQRFIRAPHIFTDPVPRQPMPKSDNPTYLFGNKVTALCCTDDAF